MIIFGTYFFTWMKGRTSEAWQCAQCGTIAPFLIKHGMRFFTIFFVIPIFPISGIRRFAACPACGARYAMPEPELPVVAARAVPPRAPRASKRPILILLILGGGLLAGLLLFSCVMVSVMVKALATPTTSAVGAGYRTPTSKPMATSAGAGFWSPTNTPPVKPLFGPVQGQLVHRTDDFIASRSTGLRVRDFWMEVRFSNPYDSAEHQWDYGVLFRETSGEGSQHYRLVIRSDGTWALTFRSDQTTSQLIDRGVVASLDRSPSGTNLLQLAATGGTATFSVNGQLIATLDVSTHQAIGDLSIGTGILRGDMVIGKATRFEGFVVWADSKR